MLLLHMKAKVLTSFAYYKATSRGSAEEEGTQMRANILMSRPGKGTGGWLVMQGEEMLQPPASPAGVFFTSVQ